MDIQLACSSYIDSVDELVLQFLREEFRSPENLSILTDECIEKIVHYVDKHINNYRLWHNNGEYDYKKNHVLLSIATIEHQIRLLESRRNIARLKCNGNDIKQSE